MIDHSQTRLTALALHRVGNRHREEANFVSDQLIVPTPEQEGLLLNYLLRSFAKCSEVYQFRPDESVVCDCASAILNDVSCLLSRSAEILEHLYEQSAHPHIKEGEVFVAHLEGIYFEGELMDAVGIFKAEIKSPFFKIAEHGGQLELSDEFGVNAQRLDKGCLILKPQGEKDLKVLVVDANNYDAEYWKVNFLNITQANDHHFQTRNNMEMVKEFSREVFSPNNKTEQIAFVNESVQYMDDKGAWDNDDFGVTVLRNADLQNAFNDYRQQYSERAGVALEDSFDISVPELQYQKKRFRNQIGLDTGIRITLPFSPDGSQPNVERGYDEERGMFFYKVFFLKEGG